MALVLCKGKPYSPPTIHGYTFTCRGAENEFPGPNTPWGADVEEKDFHKFLIGVAGSPFWLEDSTVVVPPPPPPAPVVADQPLVVPGSVPTKDPEAAAALALAAAASGALNTDTPPLVAGDTPPADIPPDPREVAYVPYAALRSKAEIATLAKADLGLEMDPENSKMTDMLELVKAAIAERFPVVPPPAQA